MNINNVRKAYNLKLKIEEIKKQVEEFKGYIISGSTYTLYVSDGDRHARSLNLDYDSELRKYINHVIECKQYEINQLVKEIEKL